MDVRRLIDRLMISKGAVMKRIIAILIMLLCTLSGSFADATAEGTKGALQVGAGVANTTGGVEFSLGFQVITLHAAGLVCPSPWMVLIADISYGIPTTYKRTYDNETMDAKAGVGYVDALLGAYKDFSDGGMIYLAAGVAVGFGSFEMSGGDGPPENIDVKTSVGFSCGAGLTLPMTDAVSGFANIRQRFVTSEVEVGDNGDRWSMDISTGGTELTVGLAFMFGG
jgi:hypothetical protein